MQASLAQEGKLVAFFNLENSYPVIKLKWYGPKIIYNDGVNIYRKKIEDKAWIKVNNSPIRRKRILPDLDTLSNSLRMAYEVCNENNISNISGPLQLNCLIESFKDESLAQFMGIFWKDSLIESQSRYLYKVVLANDKKTVLALDTVETFYTTIFKSPKGFTITNNNQGIELTWEKKDDSFWAVNVYRKVDRNTNYTKINQLPVMAIEPVENRMKKRNVKFIDKSTKENKTYSYQIRAISYFNLESEPSKTLTTTIHDTTPPPSPLSLRAVALRNNTLEIHWANRNYLDATHLSIFQKGINDSRYHSISPNLNLTDTLFIDKTPYKSAYYKICAIDSSGNQGCSHEVFVEVEDMSAPLPPINLKAVGDSGKITLSWSKNSEPDLLGYRVYRSVPSSSPILLTATPISDTSFTDYLPYKAKNRFKYYCVATDSSFNNSSYSLSALASMPDKYPPKPPQIKSIKIDSNSLIVSWIKNAEPDLINYKLFRTNQKTGKVLLANLNPEITYYKDKSVQRKIRYKYYLIAIDSSQNQSSNSPTYEAQLDRRIRQDSLSLRAKAKVNKKKKFTVLKWQNHIEKDNLLGYVVFKTNNAGRFMKLSSLLPPETNIFHDARNNETSHKYQVRGYLKNGNLILSSPLTTN